MAGRTFLQHRVVMGWLALVLSIGISGDLVVDLVVEEPAWAATACDSSEEPDNAAEHVLMPSERSQTSGASLCSTDVNSVDTRVLTRLSFLDFSVTGFSARHDRPPRSRPVSFLTPLRI